MVFSVCVIRCVLERNSSFQLTEEKKGAHTHTVAADVSIVVPKPKWRSTDSGMLLARFEASKTFGCLVGSLLTRTESD